MQEIGIPFEYDNKKEEIKSFYLSFLCRLYVIQGNANYCGKITKQSFCEAMKKKEWNKKRINRVWQEGKAGNYLNYIGSDYLILRGKEKVMGDKGFLIKAEPNCDIGFYSFCAFVSEIYTIRPVIQTQEFYDKFKFKKSKAYNNEIAKRSFAEKKSRGQRKIAEQSGCCLKTVNNRLKKSKNITILKRYDNYNGFRLNKTNLYFTNKDISFFRYKQKNNNNKTYCKTTVKSKNTALVNTKAIFLNNSLSLNKLYTNNYDIINRLLVC